MSGRDIAATDESSKVIAQLAALTRYGEDQVWRTAEKALNLIQAQRVQNGALRTLNRALEEEVKHHRERAQQHYEAIATLDSEREANAKLTETIERLECALEWALDHATDSDHPNYPERVVPRSAYAVWQYPYLVSGTPMGGGVGRANFPSALEAVEAARMEKQS